MPKKSEAKDFRFRYTLKSKDAGWPARRSLRGATLAVVVASVCVLALLASTPARQMIRSTNVEVTVDPRVELFSTIFRLAGNREYNMGRVESYLADHDKQFELYKSHPVVQYAQQLRSERGVSYDAVMGMAVHVTDVKELGEVVDFDWKSINLDKRWTVSEAREFLEKARHFVKETSFEQFFADHKDLYDLSTQRMQQVLQDDAHLEWFDSFFGSRPSAKFHVILGMLNGGGCYGATVRHKDGHEDIYCVLGVWDTDGSGKPRFDASMLDTVVHEFTHSYTNPLVDKYEGRLSGAGEKIFPHVEDRMEQQAYGNWKTMMIESMVRAYVVRYVYANEGPVAGNKQIQKEIDSGFAWIKDLSDLLARYESQRQAYPTLDSFMPQVVAFFDDYAVKYTKEQDAVASNAPKVVSMVPENGARKANPDVEEIVITFDKPMLDGNWSVVGGGPEFPQIEGEISYDDSKQVLTIPVKLKPHWSYNMWLNRGRMDNFKSEDGTPLKSVRYKFTTGASSKNDEENIPKIVSTEPKNGAEDVDPNLKAITIRFDRKMKDGSWSVVGGGEHYPEANGKISYDKECMVLTIPVKLKPDWSYECWFNRNQYKNFRSEDGVPLKPVRFKFKTRARK